MTPIISVTNLTKTYKGGFKALNGVDLDINKGELFALLGPNGAGKTSLIATVCGLVNPSSGTIKINGMDHIRDFRACRAMIGLVPQELVISAFETVLDTVNFSRGMFGKKPDDDYIEHLLRDLSLWEKRNNMLMTLSGGMKRRVLIAKALSHQPRILFLDEPTAGVDVSLRKEMWNLVQNLKNTGVTIILTTHYIEEAENMADRIGVMNHGKVILVEEKHTLMKKLGRKKLVLELSKPLERIPQGLEAFNLELEGHQLIYKYDSNRGENGIAELLEALSKEKLSYLDLNTTQNSLEEIFVELVQSRS